MFSQLASRAIVESNDLVLKPGSETAVSDHLAFLKAMGSFLQFRVRETRIVNRVGYTPHDSYANYSTDELQAAVRQTVANLDCSVRVVGSIRDRLLPLLEQLKPRLPHGAWQSFLVDIRIRPCTLRKWRQRARLDGQRMREILFDRSDRLRPVLQTTEHESAEGLLAHAGIRLAKAVLSKDIPFATQLAREIVESTNL